MVIKLPKHRSKEMVILLKDQRLHQVICLTLNPIPLEVGVKKLQVLISIKKTFQGVASFNNSRVDSSKLLKLFQLLEIL
jgi:hypothetical protein